MPCGGTRQGVGIFASGRTEPSPPGELQARPGSEQRSFRHAQAQNRTSMGLFFRGLSMFQTSVYMTSNPVNNRGAANKRQPGAFSVGCRCLHLGLPSALLCPALLRGSPAVF